MTSQITSLELRSLAAVVRAGPTPEVVLNRDDIEQTLLRAAVTIESYAMDNGDLRDVAENRLDAANRYLERAQKAEAESADRLLALLAAAALGGQLVKEVRRDD